jgi:hypothetical protein
VDAAKHSNEAAATDGSTGRSGRHRPGMVLARKKASEMRAAHF